MHSLSLRIKRAKTGRTALDILHGLLNQAVHNQQWSDAHSLLNVLLEVLKAHHF